MSFFEIKPITLGWVLQNIDFFTEDAKSSKKWNSSIFITPPDEADKELSEEDIVNEGYTDFYINRLKKKLLSAEASQYGIVRGLDTPYRNFYLASFWMISS